MKRASHRQWVLKPQDLAVALKLVVLNGQWLPYATLGHAMHLSRFEVHAAVQRLLAARLVVEIEGVPRPVLGALQSFVIFGAPYAYPAVCSEMAVGFPTAHGVACAGPALSGCVMLSHTSMGPSITGDFILFSRKVCLN